MNPFFSQHGDAGHGQAAASAGRTMLKPEHYSYDTRFPEADAKYNARIQRADSIAKQWQQGEFTKRLSYMKAGARDNLYMKSWWAVCGVVAVIYAKQWWTLARTPAEQNL